MRNTYSLAFLVLALLWVSPAFVSALTNSALKEPARVVAVGDVHGDLNAFIAILLKAGIMEKISDEEFLTEKAAEALRNPPPTSLFEKVVAGFWHLFQPKMPEWRIREEKRIEQYRWIAGKTVLVQTGDLLDRGFDTIAVFALLRQLKKQAEEAGGAVIPLLGNHEAMNICGDLQYVEDEEILTFGGESNRKKAFSSTGFLGEEIRARDSVAVVAGTLYSHGGLSGRFAEAEDKYDWNRLTIDNINNGMRILLNEPNMGGYKGACNRFTWVWHEDGPLWNRNYEITQYTNMEKVCSKVGKALWNQKVERMVIGHNAQEDGKIKKYCDGKLVLIDVGMSAGFTWKNGRHAPAAYETTYEYEGEGDNRKATILNTREIYA